MSSWLLFILIIYIFNMKLYKKSSFKINFVDFVLLLFQIIIFSVLLD